MTSPATGDPELARVAAAFADPKRVRVLMALADGRSLPAGRLAEEAGVAASTVSNHLSILLDQQLVVVRRQGRHRYYRLASDDVEGVLEALARLAPQAPISSLREHTRAQALRTARTCYQHLAGRLGVDLLQQLIVRDWVARGNGLHDPDDAVDRFSAPGQGTQYHLTDLGTKHLAAWGIPRSALSAAPLRYCVDWTEQAHHLAGPLGKAITTRFFDLGWITRGRVPRSIHLTPEGEAGLANCTQR
ncbi:metalloregulator ArsR/SmtB family transcription factor [Kribbella lupini]|uniref:Metalloregulator ArsR/SmtB family transcription factor n=1 Tax=Kribbella lupini TaxID=291602 RepID=A0ABP4L581_9ACTN